MRVVDVPQVGGKLAITTAFFAIDAKLLVICFVDGPARRCVNAVRRNCQFIGGSQKSNAERDDALYEMRIRG